MNPWREGSRLWTIKHALLDLAHVLSRPAPLARRAFAWTLARLGSFARVGASLLPGLLAALGFGLALFALGALFLAANAAFNPSESLLEVPLERPACQRASQLLASTQDLALAELSRSTFLWRSPQREPACWRDRDGWRLILQTPAPAARWLAEPSRLRAARRWLEAAGAPHAALAVPSVSDPAATALETLGWREASRASRSMARQRLARPLSGLPPFELSFTFFNGMLAALGAIATLMIGSLFWLHGPAFLRGARHWAGPGGARRARRRLRARARAFAGSCGPRGRGALAKLPLWCAKGALIGCAWFALGSLAIALLFFASEDENPRFWAPAQASDCVDARLRPFNPPRPAPEQFGCRHEAGQWIAIGRAPAKAREAILAQAFPAIAPNLWREAKRPPTIVVAWRAAMEEAGWLPASSASRAVGDLSPAPRPRWVGLFLFFVAGGFAGFILVFAGFLADIAFMALRELSSASLGLLDRLARSPAFLARAQRRALSRETGSAPAKPKAKRL